MWESCSELRERSRSSGVCKASGLVRFRLKIRPSPSSLGPSQLPQQALSSPNP
jgi:hypothetical protein